VSCHAIHAHPGVPIGVPLGRQHRLLSPSFCHRPRKCVVPANTPSESQSRIPCQFPRQGNVQVLQVAAHGLPNPGPDFMPGTAVDCAPGQRRAPCTVRSVEQAGNSDCGYHLSLLCRNPSDAARNDGPSGRVLRHGAAHHAGATAGQAPASMAAARSNAVAAAAGTARASISSAMKRSSMPVSMTSLIGVRA
jgi:hypothetical protein